MRVVRREREVWLEWEIAKIGRKSDCSNFLMLQIAAAHFCSIPRTYNRVDRKYQCNGGLKMSKIKKKYVSSIYSFPEVSKVS